MTSVVDICNLALDLIGGQVIISLDDDTEAARLCQRNYPLARDAALRAFPWPEARRSAELAPLAAPPPWGAGYHYALPGDCLRVLLLAGTPEPPWRIEARSLLTDAGPVARIRYTARVEDPALFDALLVDAIGASLALRIVTRSRESATAFDAAQGWFRSVMAEAKRIASQERTPSPSGRSAWVPSR